MPRGNLDFDQIRAAARHGDGSLIQMFGVGSSPTGNVPMFDAAGNLIDSGKPAAAIVVSGGSEGWPAGSVPPTTAMFPTWVNQGPATLTEDATSVTLRTSSVGGDNVRGVFRTLPPAPYSILVGSIAFRTTANFGAAGIAWRDSVSGKLIAAYRRGAVHQFAVEKWHNPNSWADRPFDLSIETGTDPYLWLRLADDGVNRTIQVCMGRLAPITIFTELRGTFCLPDEVGLVLYNTSGTDVIQTAFDYQES